MAIRTIITAGYGNGTFNGTIKDVTLRGYTIGAALSLAVYTANVLCNISPTLNRLANITPIANLFANPTPTKEVDSG